MIKWWKQRFPKYLKRGNNDSFDSWTLCGERIPGHTGQVRLTSRKVSRNQKANFALLEPTLEISVETDKVLGALIRSIRKK